MTPYLYLLSVIFSYKINIHYKLCLNVQVIRIIYH